MQNMINWHQMLFGRTREQPLKKVLVLEGGGMRGAFLTGVLQAFTDRGYFPWKMIIGSSAGALTGIAYAARQIYLARDAFFTELLSDKLIRLSNILRPEKHILNLDWLVDTITGGDEPLNPDNLKRSCPVLITATDCPENTEPRTVYLDSQNDDIASALRATAAIPFLYRGFVHYRDCHFLDGALLDPIPYRKALDLGFREKEILVVVSREKGYRKKEESFWVQALYDRYYHDPKHRFLLEALDNRYLRYNEILDDLETRHKNVDVIYPAPKFNVSRLTRDREKILKGFEMGVSAARRFLNPNPSLDPIG